MDYRNLGRAGLKVSEICLGTMTFGNGADQEGATRMVNAALDAGVTFFDTGPTIQACRGCTSSSRSRVP